MIKFEKWIIQPDIYLLDILDTDIKDSFCWCRKGGSAEQNKSCGFKEKIKCIFKNPLTHINQFVLMVAF